METHTHEILACFIALFSIISAIIYKQYIKGRKLAKNEPILKTFSKGESVVYQKELYVILDCNILNRNRDNYDIKLNDTLEVERNVDKNFLHKKR